MDLKSILSDKPAPVSAPAKEAESSKDDKPADLSADVRSEKEMQAEEIAEREPAAPSAAQEPEKAEPEAKAKDDKPSDVKAEEDEPSKERARDEKGRFVPQQALHAERLKRQEAERERDQLKAAQPTKPPTSVLENEDLAFQERLTAATQPLLAKFFNLSVKIAKKGHEDWDPVAEAFVSAAQSDKRLWETYQESDDPGEYVYAVGKQLKELAEVNGDIVQYGEKKRAEGRGEYEAVAKQLKAMEAEIAALKGSREKQAQIPQSLNGEQSSPTKAPAYSGPKSLREIISS